MQGDIRETALKHPNSPIAVLRLDVNLYDPTMRALKSLFPKVSPGGYVIIDDWEYVVSGRWPAQDSVKDYLKEQSLSVEFVPIDYMAVFFKKI